MDQEERNKESFDKKWFDYPPMVLLLITVFFPIGLYAVFRNRGMGKLAKFGLCAWGVIVLLALIGANEEGANSTQPTAQATLQTEAVETAIEREEPAVVDRRTQSLVQCKYYVKNSLSSPTTANFPWPDSMERIHIGDQVYEVTGYVDSQNAYGATVRNNWLCKIKYLGGEQHHPANWDILELTFN